MKTLAMGVMILAALAVPAVGAGEADGVKAGPLLNRTVRSIEGKDVRLADYQGKVLMIVNTASRCGNTPQYAGLEEIYRKYRARGFEVLAFPANNFGGQEPGTNAEIQEFCSATYEVTFPLFGKISVKGDDQAPLYRFLTDRKTNPKYGGDIEWNFAKFLVNRKGEVVARYKAGHKPTEPDVITAIERELAKKG